MPVEWQNEGIFNWIIFGIFESIMWEGFMEKCWKLWCKKTKTKRERNGDMVFWHLLIYLQLLRSADKRKLKFDCSNINAPILHEGFVYVWLNKTLGSIEKKELMLTWWWRKLCKSQSQRLIQLSHSTDCVNCYDPIRSTVSTCSSSSSS